MPDKGKKDKGGREAHKKPLHTLKEKRRLKHEKKKGEQSAVTTTLH